MEKVFSTLRSFIDNNGKTKFCITCGEWLKEALFDVGDGVTLIEKYCDTCAKKRSVLIFFYSL